MRIGVFLALLMMIAHEAVSQQLPIIDMHMHADAPYVPNGEAAPCFPIGFCTPLPGGAKTGNELLQSTLEAMRRHDIVLAFVSDSRKNVDSWFAADPDRFMPSVIISNPADADITALRKAYEAKELRGMGELATIYEGFAPNDPRLEPFFALAEEFNQPLLIHVAGTAGRSDKFRIATGHPELLQEVLEKHPRLRIWVENAAFPFFDEMVALMYRYPNVYADLSTINWIVPRSMFHRYLRGLIDAGLGKRLMFGSDQMQWPQTIDAAIDAIESAEFLTAEQKRDIFYNNAARFLRLNDGEIARHHGR